MSCAATRVVHAHEVDLALADAVEVRHVVDAALGGGVDAALAAQSFLELQSFLESCLLPETCGRCLLPPCPRAARCCQFSGRSALGQLKSLSPQPSLIHSGNSSRVGEMPSGG